MISLEYVLGSILSLATMFLFYKINIDKNKPTFKLKLSQSYILSLSKPKLKVIEKVRKERQSDIHYKKININVLIMDDKAFWIKNNAVYTAEMEDNEIIKNSAVQVDMMGMNKVELDKMMFIIDQLTERQKNDRRNPGIR